MKKLFTLAIVTLFSAMSAMAQTVTITKTDGSTVSYNAADIQSIVFSPAEAENSIAGTYSGLDSINVGKMFPYKASEASTYTITKNDDGSINLNLGEEHIPGTVMGDLTIGTYTISNIPSDGTDKVWTKKYKEDNVQFHFKCVDASGKTTIDKDYTMDKDVCEVKITLNGDGSILVENTYQMGAMPFVIYGTYVGKKQ